MKKFLCLCLVMGLMLALGGCGESQTNSPSTNATSSENHRGDNPSLDTTNKEEIKENQQLTAVGMPPLAENLQLMYQGAEEMARAFTLCSFQTDASQTITIDGMDYNPIIDSRFNTYTKLEAYLAQYFTQEFIEEQLLSKDSCVKKAEDDVAAVIAASGAEDALYAGHVFRIDSKTDKEIRFTATVYFSEEPYLEAYFFTTPDDPSDFTTKEFAFQLDYTEKGWRYSQFPFLRG